MFRRAEAQRSATVAFALVVCAAAAWSAWRGVQNHTLQADEFAFGLAGARGFTADFFATLTAASPVNRGPERLMSLVLALPNRLFEGDTAAMFRAAHVMAAVIYALAALPAYALARMLGLERWQAALVAALTTVTPWLIFATTLLNVTVAYPLTTALVWAVVRAVTRPSPGNDLLVLVIGALGATARTSNLPFVAIAAAAVFVQVWRDRPPGERGLDALKRYPLRVGRTHPLLLAAGIVTVGAVLSVGVRGIVGGQYQGAIPTDFSVADVIDRAGMWGAMLALGTGYIVVMIALPWGVRQAAKPTDRVAGAYAVTALSLFVVFAVTTVNAPPEERYVAVMAAVAPIAFGAALFRREASALGTVLGGLVVLRIVAANVPPYDEGQLSWMVLPARQFLFRGTELRLTSAGVPEVWDIYAIVMVGAILFAVAVAFVCSPRARVRAPIAVLVAVGAAVLVLGLGAAQAQYATSKWLGAQGGNWTWEQRTFIDQAVGDEVALGWDYNPGGAGVVPYAMGQAQAYNRRFAGMIRLAGMPQTFACCPFDIVVSVDERTGRITSSTPLRRFVVAPPGFKRVGFAARPVAASPTLADFGLFDLGTQPRVSYTVAGAADDGWVPAGRSTTLRGFTSARGGEPTCVRIVMGAPADAAARYRVRPAGSTPMAGELAPGERREVRVPLSPGRASVAITGGRSGPSPDARAPALQLVDVALDCGP